MSVVKYNNIIMLTSWSIFKSENRHQHQRIWRHRLTKVNQKDKVPTWLSDHREVPPASSEVRQPWLRPFRPCRETASPSCPTRRSRALARHWRSSPTDRAEPPSTDRSRWSSGWRSRRRSPPRKVLRRDSGWVRQLQRRLDPPPKVHQVRLRQARHLIKEVDFLRWFEPDWLRKEEHITFGLHLRKGRTFHRSVFTSL